MALDATKLHRIAWGGDMGLVQYRSADGISSITAAGYFNGADERLKKGDVIIAQSKYDTASIGVSLLAVSTINTAGSVTVVSTNASSVS